MGALSYYIVKRLLLFVLVIFGVTVVSFAITNLVPGDPIVAVIGAGNYEILPKETIAEMKKSLGLDRPLYEQYYTFLVRLLEGNFGRSLLTGRPVADDIASRWPNSIELAVIALLINLAIGIPAGVFSALKRNTIIDTVSRGISLTGISIPSFLLGLMILLVFYITIPILGLGRLSPGLAAPPRVTGLLTIDTLLAGNLGAFADALWHVFPPAFVLGFVTSAYVNRLTRSSMLDILDQDYIRTAKAYGLKDRIVYYKHALRNALIPTVTQAGITFGALLSGSVVVETVFSWPGIGTYVVDASFALDFPAIMGVSIFIALIFASVNLFVDLVYGLLDPRIRYG